MPPEKEKWEVPWHEYNPPKYNSELLKSKAFADPDIPNINFKPRWNSKDGKINRISFLGRYKIINGYPINPQKRTGLRGRGVFSRWGPNHATNLIVTRWKRNNGLKQYHDTTKKPILQFISIKRRDCEEWALPGDIIKDGEKVLNALKRKFMEEVLDILDKNRNNVPYLEIRVNNTFRKGTIVYKGYADDPRNTDNSWLETVAAHFHDKIEKSGIESLFLSAGDDATNVKWMDIDRSLKLYSNQHQYVKNVLRRFIAHW